MTAQAPCEICGNEAFMDFNCLLPSFGVIVKAPICESCFRGAHHDILLAIDVIKKRAEAKGIALPMTPEQMIELAEGGPA